MNYILNHWRDFVEVVGGVVIVARIIVKIVPGNTDNEMLEKAIDFLKHLGLHIDSNNKS